LSYVASGMRTQKSCLRPPLEDSWGSDTRMVRKLTIRSNSATTVTPSRPARGQDVKICVAVGAQQEQDVKVRVAIAFRYGPLARQELGELLYLLQSESNLRPQHLSERKLRLGHEVLTVCLEEERRTDRQVRQCCHCRLTPHWTCLDLGS
jgi:hypothetical protein